MDECPLVASPIRIERVLDEHEPAPAGDLDTVRAADQWSRVRASEVLK
jgi:hypothetical protein